MLTTGLLSLNIHEALACEGAELCLHPDLFITEYIVGSTTSNGASQTTRAAAAAKAAAAATAALSTGTSPATSDDATPTSSAQLPTAAQPTGLSVGDMIEIRVWDPLPKHPPRSPVSVLLKTATVDSSRPSPPSGASSQQSVTNGVVPLELRLHPQHGPPPSPSTLRPRSRTTDDSLQYSEASETTANASGNDNHTVDGAFTVVPSFEKYRSTGKEGATTVTTGEDYPPPPTKTIDMIHPLLPLPPVFPKARSNTLEGLTKSPKRLPNNITRRVATTSTTASSGIPAFQAPNPVLSHPAEIYHRGPTKVQNRHVREMSDMTVETVDLQPAESHDEDADADVWSKVSTSHKLRLSFVLLVTEKTLNSLKGNTRTQVSMLRQVADLYSLSSFDMVTIHKIDPHDEPEVLRAVSADFVLVTIKDQFISRGDMQFFQTALLGTWMYEGQRLTESTRGLKAHAREIRHGNFSAKSGIVTKDTMITFRSRSSRIFWLVQLSCEMWDYTSPYERSSGEESVCEVYFDQWIRFIYKLFAKWKELEVRGWDVCVSVNET
jgi:hypothetical protein